MEPKTILTALIGYGKGPAIRYLIVALLWAMKGQSGIDEAKAGAFANAAWDLAAPILLTLGIWAWGSIQRKKLADSEPPAKQD